MICGSIRMGRWDDGYMADVYVLIYWDVEMECIHIKQYTGEKSKEFGGEMMEICEMWLLLLLFKHQKFQVNSKDKSIDGWYYYCPL
jgi:hypothetical protein